MTTKFQEILALLPKLSPDELKQVKTRVSFLLGQGKTKAEDKNEEFNDWLTLGIVYELQRRGTVAKDLNNFILKKSAPSSYVENCAMVCKHLEGRVSSSILDPVQLVILGRMVARCEADYLSFFGEVSLRQMLCNIGNIPIAIERSYPGYVQSGMLDFLVHKGKL